MHVIEKGRGTPLVLIPPLQGRWEYIEPTVDALARSFHVITFSLLGDPGWEAPAATTMDSFVAQARDALDAAGVGRAIVCGISFGGIVALRFAVEHADRTTALILASTPGPGWHLRPRHEMYARRPRLFGPLFMIEAPWRFRAEFAAALPALRDRARFLGALCRTFLRAPVSLVRMAARARLIASADIAALCRDVHVPTLIVTGERALDHVVPVDGSSRYVELIAGARGVVLERTGHHGTITRPDAFAAVVADFARSAVDGRADRAAS